MKTEELINAVRQIDSEAAAYMVNKAVHLDSYVADNDDCLSTIFQWAKTPQGDEYWRNINRKLLGGAGND